MGAGHHGEGKSDMVGREGGAGQLGEEVVEGPLGGAAGVPHLLHQPAQRCFAHHFFCYPSSFRCPEKQTIKRR